jgi:ribosomal protein L11 methyltransferase
MTWWAIDVRTAPERRESVGAWLVARTGHAVEERDDGTLVTFAESEAGADELVAALRADADPAAQATRRRLDQVDWSTRWREGLAARCIGRLTVTPSWVAAPSEDGPVVVVDPETAFGSGEHGSTRAALALLDRYVTPGDRVLDLGSGSGILSIAAVKLDAARASGIEVDPEANEVARRNAERNGVTDRVNFFEGDAADLAPLLGPAEIVLSNILRSINTALLPAIHSALAPDGLAIFAGMEEPEAELFRPALAGRGFRVLAEVSDAGWWAVAARRA